MAASLSASSASAATRNYAIVTLAYWGFTLTDGALRMLVLLQTGDEVLDYRQARDYYSQDGAQCPMLIERGGDHFMHDLQDKIPLVVDFLFGRSGPARAGAQCRFG